MNELGVKQYIDRMERVCDYIKDHMDADLSVEQLSEVACFSKYHFHRQFSVYTGMTVARYIVMLRFKRAAQQLAYEPTKRIIDIALQASFESPESFSRAFKKSFDLTPSQFRQNPDWDAWRALYVRPIVERKFKMNVDIVDFDGAQVAVLEHRGPVLGLDASVEKFNAWRQSTPYSPAATSRSFALVYDDPETTEPAQFRMDLCAEVEVTIDHNPQGLINKSIPAGRCAVLRHKGNLDNIGDKARHLYCNWLPESGEELRDFPCFFHYTNLRDDTPDSELVTDIYLPLS